MCITIEFITGQENKYIILKLYKKIEAVFFKIYI